MSSRLGPVGTVAWLLAAALSSPAAATSTATPDPMTPAGVSSADEARLAGRGVRWRPMIEETAGRHGVDPLLLEALVAVESGFDPEAVSAAGAVGLTQLMPRTAVLLGLDDPFEPAGNLEAGARYLAQLLRAFEGDRRLAVAAYNAGEGAVRRSGGVPAIPETRRHVWKVERYLAHRAGLPLTDAAGDATIVLRPGAAPVRLPPAAPPTVRAERDQHGRLVFRNAPARSGSR